MKLRSKQLRMEMGGSDWYASISPSLKLHQKGLKEWQLVNRGWVNDRAGVTNARRRLRDL